MSAHRWPPQPGDLVKVERSTAHDADEEGANAMIGKVCEVDRCYSIDGGFVPVLQPNRKDWWYFNLSDLSPADPPQTVEQFGRTYRLDEGWQPIETAPKDGTRVLFWVRGFGRWMCVCGSWDIERYATKPKPHWTHDNERSNGIRETRANQPTHWMPLPAPPATEEPTS